MQWFPCATYDVKKCVCCVDCKNMDMLEAQWLGGRMPDSRSREHRHEFPAYDGAVDGDLLWRRQNKIIVLVLGNIL